MSVWDTKAERMHGRSALQVPHPNHIMRIGAIQNVGRDSRSTKHTWRKREREVKRYRRNAKGRERMLESMRERKTVFMVVYV